MALAFSGQGGTLWDVMARDAFFDALSDQSLRVRVLEKDPMTLDEALKITCRMEAIAMSPPEDDYDETSARARRRRPSHLVGRTWTSTSKDWRRCWESTVKN